MVTHVSGRETQFSYFDQMLEGPVWKGGKTLDFGGNMGGFLAGAGNHVDHDDYWCLDLTRGAIEQGRRKFPRAHFVHYNRYSSYFNADGIRHLPIPDLGVKFDMILAFSVFTHTHRSEMLSSSGNCAACWHPAVSSRLLSASRAMTGRCPLPNCLRVLTCERCLSGSRGRTRLLRSKVWSREHGNRSGVFSLTTNSMWNRATSSASKSGRAGPESPTARTLGGPHGVALPGCDHAPAGQPRMAALLHHQKRMGLTHASD